MKILITGATGFLGSHIAEQLVSQGHEIRCLIRQTANQKFLASLRGVEFCTGDLADCNALQRAVSGVDGIVHAAGLVKARSPQEFITINVKGTADLLKAAANIVPALKRFVLVSSLAAQGPSLDGRPLSETAIQNCHPVSYYGRSKLQAEQEALAIADKLPITIIRPPLIYGPRDKECLAFFRAVKYKIFPFLGSSQNTASVIYANDAANAIIKALQTSVASGSSYFIEDGFIRTSYDMMNQLAQTMQTKLWLTPVFPATIVKTVAAITEYYGKLTGKAVMLTRDKANELLQTHWVCTSAKAQRELSWRAATDWAMGTKLTYDWYKNAQWL